MEELREQTQNSPAADEDAVVPAAEAPAPPGMSEDEVREAHAQAEELVSQLSAASGGREMEALDELANVGMQAQRDAAGQLDLLKTRVSDFLSEGGAGRDVAGSLMDLRLALDQINPHRAAGTGLGGRLMAAIPFVRGGGRVGRALQKIALRYEPVSRQIAVIETRLRDGRTMLVRDNVELRKLYEQVELQQQATQQNAYLGELLMRRLARLLDETEDPAKRERVQGALHDVAMRVQDLRTMEEVHLQYFVSIEMGRQNNNRLGQSVERTLAMATNVVTVGLAIQAAMVRQRRVMEATQRTRAFLGEVVAANAGAIRRHTAEIGDIYSNPVIAIDKITAAHDDLLEALATAGRLRAEGIETATANIAKVSQLSAGLLDRVTGLAEAGKEAANREE